MKLEPLARDAAGGSSVGEYGSPQQRALQLLREKHPRPLRRQSLPVSIHPQGEPTLPHIDRHGTSIAKPPLTYTHPSLRGKPPPPAGKPPTLELVDRGRRKSTGDLGTRLNIPRTLRPPPPRCPPPPTAKTIAPIAWGAGGALQSVHDIARRRSSDFRRPPPGPPPSERRLSAIVPSNPPRALPSNSQSPTIGYLREDERQRNPSISTGNEEALAVRRTSFSAFKGTLPSESAIDGSMKGASTHRQATSDGQTTYNQSGPNNQALAKPTPRPLHQLPKRRPSTELVSCPGKPPPPRPAGEPPAGQIRRYSISHELCEGVGDFSRRASMITLRGSADTDAGPVPSVPQGDYQARRLSSDGVLGLPRGKEGGEQSSPPQPSLGGQATILWYNMGVTRQKEMDAKGAVECYQRAVKDGHAKAQHNLAAMYEKGAPGVPKDDVEAVRLFRLAADQGLAESCYSLAMHIKFGLGVEQDDAQCVYYLEKASEYGLAKAMFNLGLMYEKRRGVSRDAPEVDLLEATRECYEAAAEAGVTKAMVNLGVLYLSGRLHGHQPEEALEWFKKAGDAGDLSGLWNLSLCYERGVGVPQDHLAAQALQQQCMERERQDRQNRAIQAIGADAAANRAPPGRRESEPLTNAPVHPDDSNGSSFASGRAHDSRRRSPSVPFVTPLPPNGASPKDEKQHDCCQETSTQELETKNKTTRGSNTGYVYIPSADRPAEMHRTVTAISGVADGGTEQKKFDCTEESNLTPTQARGRKDSLLLKPSVVAIARVKAAVERRKKLEAAAAASKGNSRPN